MNKKLTKKRTYSRIIDLKINELNDKDVFKV